MDVVDLFIDFFILILFAVIGFGIYYATNTTGWDALVVSIWAYLPVVFIGFGIIAMAIKIKYMGK